MLKLIQKIMQLPHRSASMPSEQTPRQQAGSDARDYRADPLSHPALRAMDQRQLGDLPFDPRCFGPWQLNSAPAFQPSVETSLDPQIVGATT
jgi:hypothetical protein